LARAVPFFFVSTLWALGALGGVTLILAARGLWTTRGMMCRYLVEY